jgi:hypothetical protein
VSTNATTKNRLRPPRREIDADNIPAALRETLRFVIWNWDWNAGSQKWDKPPLSAATRRRTSKTDPASWSSFDDALALVSAGTADGVGFCIAKKNDHHPTDDDIIVIDLDNCIDVETGLPNEWASYLLELFSDSYAEVSPSGHGIKIFVRGKLGPGQKENDSRGIELLGPGSYVCVTGLICPGSSSELAEAQERIDYLQQSVVQEQIKTSATGMSDRELTLEALQNLAPWRCDDYKSWVRVGQCLHSADQSLCGEWDSWSRGSDKYQDGACSAKWATFSAGGGLGIGTLVYWAKEDGWTPPKRQPNQNGQLNGAAHHNIYAGNPRTAPPAIEKFTARTLMQKHPRLHEPIIGHLLRAGETMNIISVSKIGKSWLLYSLLLSLVTGRPWLGRFPTSKGKCLLIDNELHPPTLANRLKTVAEEMKIDLGLFVDDLHIWPLRGRIRNLYELRHEFEALKGIYQFIAIDALYRMLPADASENDNAQMTQLYNESDHLAGMTGAAMGFVHHSSKGSQSDKRITDVGSGAGAQSRATDAHLVLREHEDENAVVLDAAVRSFKPVVPVVLRWNFPLWVPDETADATMLKGKKSVGDERQGKNDDEADNMILKLSSEFTTREELKRESGYGYTRADRCIRRLVDAKRLDVEVEERKGKQIKLYRRSGECL